MRPKIWGHSMTMWTWFCSLMTTYQPLHGHFAPWGWTKKDHLSPSSYVVFEWLLQRNPTTSVFFRAAFTLLFTTEHWGSLVRILNFVREGYDSGNLREFLKIQRPTLPFSLLQKRSDVLLNLVKKKVKSQNLPKKVNDWINNLYYGWLKLLSIYISRT